MAFLPPKRTKAKGPRLNLLFSPPPDTPGSSSLPDPAFNVQAVKPALQLQPIPSSSSNVYPTQPTPLNPLQSVQLNPNSRLNLPNGSQNHRDITSSITATDLASSYTHYGLSTNYHDQAMYTGGYDDAVYGTGGADSGFSGNNDDFGQLSNAAEHGKRIEELKNAMGKLEIDLSGIRLVRPDTFNEGGSGSRSQMPTDVNASSTSISTLQTPSLALPLSEQGLARSRASSFTSVTVHKPAVNGAGESPEGEEVAIVIAAEDMEDLGKLGEGAGGEVRKARHKPTGLLMAKKTIATSPNPAVHRQILRELSFNRECNNDYIVKYYGAFLEENDSQIAIFMEFGEGGSLDAISKRIVKLGATVGEKVLGKVAEGVLHGLVYLHERKIIHRDIKPSNILVTRSGQIKLCDFGVSGELVKSEAKTFTGTSYYMAPERIQGGKYAVNADVWSLGLTILELAMNRFPFPPEGEPPLGPIELLTYIIKMDVPKLENNEALGIKWSKGLKDFINLCLEKNPKLRPSPKTLLQHAWIKKSEERPNDFLATWVKKVWGWE